MTPQDDEMIEVKASITEVTPLAPILVSFKIENPDTKKEEESSSLFFLNQASGEIYQDGGPIDEEMAKAILGWIEKKNEEVRRQVHSRLATATPEQLKQMGIDINQTDDQKDKPNIII
ncbi:MAG: hypothetical protein ACOCV1_02415 [Bacillota bacterium]